MELPPPPFPPYSAKIHLGKLFTSFYLAIVFNKSKLLDKRSRMEAIFAPVF
nr:MAG TPA: hypothetical protein [Bacteriophage sp.]